jgi:hypothetical protein
MPCSCHTQLITKRNTTLYLSSTNFRVNRSPILAQA